GWECKASGLLSAVDAGFALVCWAWARATRPITATAKRQAHQQSSQAGCNGRLTLASPGFARWL
ncbi:hypothetical protein AVDCRST_MAG94-439, partial [uncultured Leptolyngbya sp.]